MYFVYILYSNKLDRYYVGSTGNPEDRLKRHNSGRSTYTKPGIPWNLVYLKEYQTRSQAYSAEQYIKSRKSRIFITAEFILRGESSAETCLKGSTFIRHEGAKTRSRQIIGIHQ